MLQNRGQFSFKEAEHAFESQTEAFYAQSVHSFSDERKQFHDFIQLITPNKGELHVLDWEYRSGLENASASVAEKDRVKTECKRLINEITAAKELQTKMKAEQSYRVLQIQRLSELSQPVQRDQTYLVADKYLEKHMYTGVTTMINFTTTNTGTEQDDASASATAPATTPSSSTSSSAPSLSSSKMPKGSKMTLQQQKDHAAAAAAAASKAAPQKHQNPIRSLRTGEIIALESKLEQENRSISIAISDLNLALKEVDTKTSTTDHTVSQILEKNRKEAAELIQKVDSLDYQGTVVGLSIESGCYI